jgi:hypothetical protein
VQLEGREMWRFFEPSNKIAFACVTDPDDRSPPLKGQDWNVTSGLLHSLIRQGLACKLVASD